MCTVYFILSLSLVAGMACSIEGIQPEFVPPCVSDSYCDQLAELLVNESALDELWRAQGKIRQLQLASMRD